jgi:ribosome-associated protein
LEAHAKALLCARLADAKKADRPVILELKGISALADYFVICSAGSSRSVQAIAAHIEKMMKEQGMRALGIEGLSEGSWVLMDYDDVIIHIFKEPERAFYDLENLWTECPRVPCEGSAVD